jgi:hypothetical protein
MAETGKAWLITYGEYSDYGVLAVFTDRALLDAYVEMHVALGKTVDVEEYELNPGADVLRERRLTWHVSMDWDGNDARVEQWGPMLSDPNPIVRWWHPASPYGHGGQGRWRTWIIARDADHAVKAVNEGRLIAISEGVPRGWDDYFAWLKRREETTGRADVRE